jgi:hypothetical protein
MRLLSALGRLRAPGPRGRYLKFYERKILGGFLAPPENPAQPAKSYCTAVSKGQNVTDFLVLARAKA